MSLTDLTINWQLGTKGQHGIKSLLNYKRYYLLYFKEALFTSTATWFNATQVQRVLNNFKLPLSDNFISLLCLRNIFCSQFRKMSNYAKPVSLKNKFISAYLGKHKKVNCTIFTSIMYSLSRQQNDLKAEI